MQPFHTEVHGQLGPAPTQEVTVHGVRQPGAVAVVHQRGRGSHQSLSQDLAPVDAP